VGDLVLPCDGKGEFSVYHTFIIQTAKRDALKQYLADHDVDSKVHYPVPVHLQEAAQFLGYKRGDFPVTERQAETILSLPVFAELTDEQVAHVANTVTDFFNAKG
jgi:dTDP-4-amino-4,6-dideoxygalactose transaminase